MKIGLQLYSVRDEAEKSLRSAILKTGELGYGFVEFAGFFSNTAEDVKQWLCDAGLEVTGIHIGLEALMEDVDGTAKYLETLGCKDCIIPCSDVDTVEKREDFISRVKVLISQLSKYGLRLSFHNHDNEFVKNEDGKVPLFEMLERTEMLLELDTFWAYAAGYDPLEIMEKYADKLIYIHLKDGFADGSGVPLGKGTAPVMASLNKAVEMQVPVIVESETLTPSGLDEADICIKYLRALGK